ncbi:MAG: Asp-tRNA(Asn)/Glu-tRNA(Gln) amidotransferase subunit GatB [Candidatus Odinarchaeia archaeon]
MAREILEKEENVMIGLECHVQLTVLKTKLFCSCPSDYRGKDPNTFVCPTCLGLPGSLPVLNEDALKYAIMAGLALNCEISDRLVFFRKNYYYPDMPKNFQISQYDRVGGVPLASNGYVMIKTRDGYKKIRIRRIHLEEDPARIVYLGSIRTSSYALVDYNRAGIALLEIVTEPDMKTAEEAQEFLRKLRSIIEHLGISDGSLPGSMRCDTNISIGRGKRVEIKNISSFKEVRRAIKYEILRQKQLLKRGVKIEQETRHWDEAARITVSLRTKETEQDYRYFPEPDLVPLEIPRDLVDKIAAKMPELPDKRKERFLSQYNLPEHDAEVLTGNKALADFLEECVKLYPYPKKISNWLISDVQRRLNELDIEITESKLTPGNLVEMLNLIDDGVISVKIAKRIIRDVVLTGQSPKSIVEAAKLIKISDSAEIERIAREVFGEFPEAVDDALRDPKAINFLIGQIMRKTQGKADPKLANAIVRKLLNESKK